MKREMTILLAFVFMFIAVPVISQVNEKPFVVPELREWKGSKGNFVPSEAMRIVYPEKNEALKKTAFQFAKDYYAMFNTEPEAVTGKAKKGDIVLSLKKDKALGTEGYTIKIGDKVEVTAPTAEGLFWATRTLLQMAEQNGGQALPKGVIRDYPDYALRGFMLDCGRKYIPMHFVREYVKFMSYYKMNTLQIHLNDNGFKQYFENDWNKTPAAFRLESEYFPGLTARDGYYTKQEFRELQMLADSLGVEIIPEIDAPAHSLAFTHYRPSLGSEEYGMDHLDLFKNETYTFLDSLYDEYLGGDNPVFMGKRVHIGTDEYSNRKKDVVEKFRYFTDYYIKKIESYGKQACVWGALTHAKGDTPVKSENVLMHAWYNGYADPTEMMKQGYDLVSIPDGFLYIVPAAGYYYDFLNCKYLYENWTPAQIGNQKFEERHPQIKGGMFAVWNDHAGNGISIKDIHYRVYPAMQTLAVKMWTGAKPQMAYDAFDKARLALSDAPGVKIAGRFKGGNRDILKLATLKPGTITDIEEIGFAYTVSFDITAANEQSGTELFRSRDAVFYLADPISGMMGFARDGYLNNFNFRLFPGEKAHIEISGDQYTTSLYVNGKLIEKMNRQTKLFNDKGKDKMYYVRTLVFPLAKAGQFNSKITNFKVVNYCK
jgi:hexosaminidase